MHGIAMKAFLAACEAVVAKGCWMAQWFIALQALGEITGTRGGSRWGDYRSKTL